jgi:FAD/FMN-containing dehydrogenase
MIDDAIALDGSFYMPYEIVATKEQFKAAYPNHNAFFETKAKYDPENRFTNKLWDKYYSSK